MDCNAPINIIKRTTDKCSLKCLLWYKYGNSSCTVKNATDQLLIHYDGDSDVMFNSVSYNPVEVRIFKPSIHQFDGSHADAEIVIVHTGANGGLLLCIPVMASANANASTATNLLNDIIKNAPATNQTSSLNLTDFNLNFIVPKSSYFSYTGTLPYECVAGKEYNYVVFPKNSLIVNQLTLTNLGNLIHDSYITTHERVCFFNEMGTKNNGFAGDGQIYIDCQPTGEEGEIIYKEQSTSSSSTKTMSFEWLYSFLYVIVGMILLYGSVKLLHFLFLMVNKMNTYP